MSHDAEKPKGAQATSDRLASVEAPAIQPVASEGTTSGLKTAGGYADQAHALSPSRTQRFQSARAQLESRARLLDGSEKGLESTVRSELTAVLARAYGVLQRLETREEWDLAKLDQALAAVEATVPPALLHELDAPSSPVK